MQIEPANLEVKLQLDVFKGQEDLLKQIKLADFSMFLEFLAKVEACETSPVITKLPQLYNELPEVLKSDESLLYANMFCLTKRGVYYNKPEIKLGVKIIFFNNKDLFSKYSWDIEKISEKIYLHDIKLKDNVSQNTRIRPFRHSPAERLALKKYLDTLQNLGLLVKKPFARSCVQLFLIPKHRQTTKGFNHSHPPAEKCPPERSWDGPAKALKT